MMTTPELANDNRFRTFALSRHCPNRDCGWALKPCSSVTGKLVQSCSLECSTKASRAADVETCPIPLSRRNAAVNPGLLPVSLWRSQVLPQSIFRHRLSFQRRHRHNIGTGHVRGHHICTSFELWHPEVRRLWGPRWKMPEHVGQEKQERLSNSKKTRTRRRLRMIQSWCTSAQERGPLFSSVITLSAVLVVESKLILEYRRYPSRLAHP